MPHVARATRFVEECGSDRPQLMRAVVMFHLRERHHVEQLVSQIARLAPTRDRRYYGAVNGLPQDLVKGHHDQADVRPPHPVQDAVRHRRRDRLAGARHRRQRRHLLLLPPDAARIAGGAGAGEPGQPRGTRTEAGLPVVQSGWRLRRSLQLRDVPRYPTRADHVHRRCGAPAVRRQPVVSGPDAQRPGPAGLRQLLSGARADPGARTPSQSRGRSRRRRITCRGPESRVLGNEIRLQPRCAQPASSSSTARR